MGDRGRQLSPSSTKTRFAMQSRAPSSLRCFPRRTRSASHPAVRIEEIDGAEIARRAIEKCLRWKNPKRLDPGRYTVVLEPAAAGELIVRMGSLKLQARSAEEGRSFLSRKGGGTLVGD